MSFETLEDIYQAAHKLPLDQRRQLIERLRTELTPRSEGNPERECVDGGGASERQLPRWFTLALELAEQIDREAREKGIELPTDLAENHDYYAHGMPRK